MDTHFFEQIKDKYAKKKVISLCNKLGKRCSFKSFNDVENLCNLAYWLYIYDNADSVISIAKETHKLEFDGDWRVWTFIVILWGLEIRILETEGKSSEAQKVIVEIDRLLLIPNEIFNTPEKKVNLEAKRRPRFVYPDVAKKSNIENNLKDGNVNSANDWRLAGLRQMIGYGATGLYPNLEAHKAEMEKDIQDYINELKKVK